MTVAQFLFRARRALHKSPRHLAGRIVTELRHELDRFTQPRLAARIRGPGLLERTEEASVDALWERVFATESWPFAGNRQVREHYEEVCPGDLQRIETAARSAHRHEIDLLGSGPTSLGKRIDWSRDYKTGDRWPTGYFRAIDYVNRGRSSDVKTAWELSRLQWVIPCGQAYALTGDDAHARAAREIIEQWIAGNAYARTVNWSVTMEPALRLITMAWLMRACGDSDAWADTGFRHSVLSTLYLHALFTERFIEHSDVNGNHFTADAAALVVAGALFGRGADAPRWLDSGLADLEREIRLQVHPDGVDFEASTAYHRLVAELFLLGSMAATSAGHRTSQTYRERLAGMACFTAAYTRPDGLAPLWGDHDDARVLPCGAQAIRDHRYLIGLIGLHLDDPSLIDMSAGERTEAVWWFGSTRARVTGGAAAQSESLAFQHGGVYVLRGPGHHVFVDCGPVGLAGRGGHGHNDLLSFEAFLAGVPVVTEGGCYVYTADFESRQRDRSVVSHNAPIVDGEETNRFVAPDQLWMLNEDARGICTEFSVSGDCIRFAGRHDGYRRLTDPVLVEREIELIVATGELRFSDHFVAQGEHDWQVPVHLAYGATAEIAAPGRAWVHQARQSFELEWNESDWRLAIDAGREGPSYGVMRAVVRLVFSRRGAPSSLRVCLRPIGLPRTATGGELR